MKEQKNRRDVSQETIDLVRARVFEECKRLMKLQYGVMKIFSC